jgi:hypothetical protein
MRKMLFTLPVLCGVMLCSVVLCGCSSEPAGPATSADFIPGSNVIQVIVNDPRPVHSVQLVFPTGEAIPAAQLHTERTISPGFSSGPSVGLGVGRSTWSGGSGVGTSMGIGIPLGGSSAPPTSQSITSGTIAIADPEGYRRNWQSMRIEVQIGDPPSLLTLMAPPPPA